MTEVKGFGRQKGHVQFYRGSEITVGFLPKFKVETVVANGDLERVCDVIINSAKTGKFGDGKIFVSKIEKATRIRTGETGERAVSGSELLV